VTTTAMAFISFPDFNLCSQLPLFHLPFHHGHQPRSASQCEFSPLMPLTNNALIFCCGQCSSNTVQQNTILGEAGPGARVYRIGISKWYLQEACYGGIAGIHRRTDYSNPHRIEGKIMCMMNTKPSVSASQETCSHIILSVNWINVDS
jgi:hypothetical protein